MTRNTGFALKLVGLVTVAIIAIAIGISAGAGVMAFAKRASAPTASDLLAAERIAEEAGTWTAVHAGVALNGATIEVVRVRSANYKGSGTAWVEVCRFVKSGSALQTIDCEKGQSFTP